MTYSTYPPEEGGGGVSPDDVMLLDGTNPMEADMDMAGFAINNIGGMLFDYQLIGDGITAPFGSASRVIFHGVNGEGDLPLVTAINSGITYVAHSLAIVQTGSNDIVSSGSQLILKVGNSPFSGTEVRYRLSAGETVGLEAYYDVNAAAGYWIVTSTSIPKVAVKILTPSDPVAIVGFNLCDASTGSFTITKPSGSDFPGEFMVFRNIANDGTENVNTVTLTSIDGGSNSTNDNISSGHSVILMADRLTGNWYRIGAEGVSSRRASANNTVLLPGVNILDASGGTRNFILPSPSQHTGQILYLYREDDTTNSITMDTTSSGTVIGAGANFPFPDGGTALILASVPYTTGGSFWYVIANRDNLHHRTRTELVTTDKTITADTNTITAGKRLALDASIAPFAVTIPAATGAGLNGLEFEMIRINSGGNATTVTPTSGTINGAANYVFSQQFQAAIFKNINQVWYVFETYQLPLPVSIANGGTGTNTLTDHGAVVVSGTNLTTVSPGNAGERMASNGTDWVSAPGTQFFIFGHQGVVASAATSYMYPGSGISAIAEIQLVIPRAMTLTSIYVQATAAPGVGKSDNFQPRLNGSNVGALSLNLSGTSTQASVTGQSVAVSAGDLLSVRLTSDTLSTNADPIITIEGY